MQRSAPSACRLQANPYLADTSTPAAASSEYVLLLGPATAPASFTPQNTELPSCFSAHEKPAPATSWRMFAAPWCSGALAGGGCAPPVTKPGTVWWMLVQSTPESPERP